VPLRDDEFELVATEMLHGSRRARPGEGQA